MTKRRAVTKAMRLRIWNAHGGVCHLCKLPIHAERGEKWDVEHIKPLWNDGPDEESNMAPAHKDCHAPKTAGESKVRAKGNNQRAAHLGIKSPSSRPIASRGFTKAEKLPRNGAVKIVKNRLPPRQLYKDADHE